MIQTDFSRSAEIAVPTDLVWSVMADVERWPEWTPSISRVKSLSKGPLHIGSRVRIHQPKLPPAFWRVTDLYPGESFTWVSRAPGVLVTARHKAEPSVGATRVNLSIHYEGLFGPLLARWTRDLNERYLTMEMEGLKARCTRAAAMP